MADEYTLMVWTLLGLSWTYIHSSSSEVVVCFWHGKKQHHSWTVPVLFHCLSLTDHAHVVHG